MSPNTNISSTSTSNNNGTDNSGCGGGGGGTGNSNSVSINSNAIRPNNNIDTEIIDVVNVSSHDGISDDLTENPNTSVSFSTDKNLESNKSQESLIHRSLRYLDSALYSDLTLIVGKHEIKAHKMILMMASPYFEAQLGKDPDLRKRKFHKFHKREFKVEGVRYNELRLFLQCLYSRVAPTKVEDAWAVLRCATKFQVPCLADTACKLLESAMAMPTKESQSTGLSVLSILEGALTYNRQDLQESALDCICKNAFQLLGSRQFTMLSAEALGLIIARDDLCAFDELQVFSAILRWAVPEYSEGFEDLITNEQKRVLRSYFEHVRFCQMTEIEFEMYCLPLKVLDSEDVVSILRCFHLPINQRHDFATRFVTSARDYYKQTGPVNKIETVKGFTTKHDRWFQKSQIRFRFDQAGWISHIRLAPSVYSNYNLTVKCKVKLSNDNNKSNKEIVGKVITTIGTLEKQCPIIIFEEPVRIQAAKWYSITARISKKVASSREYYIYKCEGGATKGQFEVGTGEVVAFELDPEFTNNEVTQVGFICQPNFPIQEIPSEFQIEENKLACLTTDKEVVPLQHEPLAVVPEEPEPIEPVPVRMFAYELPLSDNLIEGKEIVVRSLDNYKHLVISKKDREQYEHFQTELNKSQDKYSKMIPYKGIPEVGELVIVWREIWRRGIVTSVDDNQKIIIKFVDTFGCAVVSTESSELRYLDKNSIEAPLFGAIIHTSTRIQKSLQDGTLYSLKLLGRHEERLYEYRGHLKLDKICPGQ